jgi:hypothetical protein
VGVNGQIAIGEGRAGAVAGGMSSAMLSFNPRSNSDGFFFQNNGGTLGPVVLNPNVAPTEARAEFRAEDSNGNISRALVKTTTGVGRASLIAMPSIPEVKPPTSSGGGTLAPIVRWTDTLTSMYECHLVLKTGGSQREWRIYGRRADMDLASVFGEVSIQLPSMFAFSTAEVGSPLPSISSLVDQYVDAIQVPDVDLNGITDFFFDDLRFSNPNPNLDQDLRFARGRRIEILY